MLVLLAVISCKKDVYHTLEVSCNPSEGGTVSPSAESFLEGETVSIKATPSSEYLFEGWSGDASGSSNPLSIVMDSDKSIIANFVKKTYSLAIEVEGNGHVEERLMGMKSDYESGSIVELTAVPDEYWKFDHWEGDITGTDNPKTVDVTGAKSVKAVFAKPQYSLNVKIVGPGVVDEYLAETKSGLDAGAQVLLKAVPSEGAVFKGWSGDIEASENELYVDLNSSKVIIATFGKYVRQYPSPELLTPWVSRKNLYTGIDFSGLTNDPSDLLAVDYNLDGYVDAITTISPEGEWISDDCPVRFYMGTPDGTFFPDEANNSLGLIAHDPRKTMSGDLNGDGIPDFILVGHGYDEEPWPGESPVVVCSNSTGGYYAQIITETVGYYHGSTVGDYDNDGDLDIVLIDHQKNSFILENDGTANFSIRDDVLDYDAFEGGMYTTELFDVNHDGYLDLVIGGHEHEGKEWHAYTNNTRVFWGDGKDFKNGYSKLPRFKDGFGVTLDYYFYDIDEDGQEEVFLLRTGDGYLHPSYIGWAIQIVKFDGNTFKDVTSQFIEDGSNGCDTGRPVLWIDVEKLEDGTFLCGRVLDNAAKYYEILGNKLVRCEEKPHAFSEGLCLYHDGSVLYNHVDFGCTDFVFSGNTSIKFFDWSLWNGFAAVDYSDWYDFSQLEKNDYCLEFAIKNSDPELEIAFAFETRLQTEPWYFPSYGYTYNAQEHKSDGEWELIRIPLCSLQTDDEWTGYYWDKIKTINIMPGQFHGKEFYLDEIRIRKIVDLQ